MMPVKSDSSSVKPQHSNVNADPSGVRHLAHSAHRENRAQEIQPPDSQEQSYSASDDGEQQAFSEQLPDQAKATGSQGQANGDLLLPRGGARQQQIGDIRASDEQHETNCCQQHEQCGPQTRGLILVQCDDLHAPILIRCRVLALQSFGDGAHLSLRLIERHV